MDYANVVICRKLGGFNEPLSYRVPPELKTIVKVGQFVRVPFRSQISHGIVVECLKDAPAGLDAQKIRQIQKVIPEEFFTLMQIRLARFIAEHYHVSFGKALRLIVPKMLWDGNFGRIEKNVPVLMPRLPELPFNQKYHDAVEQIWRLKKPVLLYGNGGAGKIELYLRMAIKTLEQSKQVLLLVPEISFAAPIFNYFKEFLGDSIAVFHSNLTERQRAQIWNKIRSGEIKLVIGSRSAVFAPFTSLGLIIVTDEHERSYKSESLPYYTAQLAAEKLSEFFGARLIFCSATPRVESYAKTKTGEYEWMDFSKILPSLPMPAFADASADKPAFAPLRTDKPAFAPLRTDRPKILIADLREEFKKKNFSIFSLLLQRKISECLGRKEKVILFVNQRGMARSVICRDCGFAEECPNCAISLKYHIYETRNSKSETRNDEQPAASECNLVCHYCGFKKEPSILCPSCKSPHIKHIGIGTERVEEETRRLFPEARVIRADSDTVRGKNGFDKVYKSFLGNEYDVLIGTQMIAKGLDYPGVGLVGIVLADAGLFTPDFRAQERVFQLLIQVAGLCGNNERGHGEVVLQTFQPDNFAISQAAKYGYKAFADQELLYREKFGYPPYGDMIKFTVTGQDAEKLSRHIEAEEETLNDIFLVNQLPFKAKSAPAVIFKVKNRYCYHVTIHGNGPQKIFDYWQPPRGWRADVDQMRTA